MERLDNPASPFSSEEYLKSSRQVPYPTGWLARLQSRTMVSVMPDGWTAVYMTQFAVDMSPVALAISMIVMQLKVDLGNIEMYLMNVSLRFKG